jgi:hypothetical protein
MYVVFVRFMYIVDVSLMYVVDISFENFLAKVNIKVDTAFQGNNYWEKCGVGGYRVGGYGLPERVLEGPQSLSMLVTTLILTLISNLRAVNVSIFRVSTLVTCRPQNLVDANILRLSTLIFLTLVPRPSKVVIF